MFGLRSRGALEGGEAEGLEAAAARAEGGAAPTVHADIESLPPYRAVIEVDPPLSETAAKALVAVDLVDERIAVLYARGRAGVGIQDVTRLRERLSQAYPERAVFVLLVGEHVISDVRMRRESEAEAQAQAAVLDDESVYRDDFRAIIQRAVAEGVSDVHLERQGDVARVRFHRPGGMQVVSTRSGAFMQRLCSVVYDTVADPAAKETKYIEARPQKTRATLRFERFRAELRIQTVPAFPDGSDMIIRILAVVHHDGAGARRDIPTLEAAGYLPQAVKVISDAAAMPNGLIVFCGTVNSGKSTTIANVLRRAIADADGRQKVMTLEDPPESTIVGATQVPIEMVRAALKFAGDPDPEANAYAEGIKIALRSDIHKLLVGEIRGAELALPLTHAVRSGHWTATTIHAGSAVEAVSRMIDLGMQPEDLAAPGFLNGVVYQRLLPGLCEHCALDHGEFPDVLRALVSEIEVFAEHQARRQARFRWRNKSGCSHCEGGVTRRLLVAEALFPDDEMRRLIRDRKMLELRERWLEGGAQPVAHHALLRCVAGEIDPQDMVFEGVRWTDLRDWVRMCNLRERPLRFGQGTGGRMHHETSEGS